jgi:hypothetical protein
LQVFYFLHKSPAGDAQSTSPVESKNGGNIFGVLLENDYKITIVSLIVAASAIASSLVLLMPLI